MPEIADDWIVKVGMDTSAVDAGAKRIEKVMARLAKMQAKLSPVGMTGKGVNEKVKPQLRDPITKTLSKRNKTELNDLKAINSLESKRLQLLRSIERAKGLGLKTQGFSQSLRGTNVTRIEQRRLELEKKITLEKRKQNAIPVKAERVTKASKKTSSFALPEDRQLKIANSIDAVTRRASRGLEKNSAEFRKINKEAAVLKKSIAGISSKSGLEGLNNRIRVLREGVIQASSAMRQMNATMSLQGNIAKGLKDSISNMARSYVSLFAVFAGGRAIARTGMAFESMSATMLLTSGSTQQANEDFKFLVSLANEAGFSVLELSKSFSKFGLAGKSAGLTDGEVKTAFEDMSITIRATGLAQDKANLSFLALQQMLSNGVVSMQELKLQLSEQLPQAMSTAETALRNLGHTSGSVKDIISTGTVESGAFVKELTRLMKEQAVETGAYEKSVNSSVAALGRFKTSLDLLIKGIFEVGGLGDGLASTFALLQKVIQGMTPVVVSFAAGIGTLFNAIGIIIMPITGLISLLGEGAGLTFVLSLVTAATINWAASMLFGKAAMDALTFSSLVNFLKSLSLTAIGTAIAQKGFLGWAGSIWAAVFSLRALKLALGPIGLAFLALEGIGALVTPSLGLPTPQSGGGNTTNSGNSITVNVDAVGKDANAVAEQMDSLFQDMFSGAEPNN